MNGQRMSKSTGNYILPMQLISGENDFFEKPFKPSVVRFCFMQAHYRSVLDISNEAMLAAEKGFNRLMEAGKILSSLPVSKNSSFDVQNWKQQCYNAMNDDFNSPILIAQLFEGVRIINLVKDGKETLTEADLRELEASFNAFVFEVLGLKDEQQATENNDKLDGVMQMLIQMRMEARANKDWTLSDKIRDELKAIGIQLKDGKDGTTYSLE
ncbi:Cysteine--tRNA ligase (fragment) [Capnocytophaga canis]|uniref:Cysteine--tRNA ligase n=2 Tax=Capnocytophaga canis TaxID=1848903 RepID=A0A0B7I7V6_9FLAO